MELFEVELLIVFSKDDMGSCGLNSISSCSGSGSSSAANCQLNSRARQQRKQRRCWSPKLHRCFVNALQQLGVAAPKQIRDLMQVDGLTNDEVKSHLQKYRLHTRKVPPTTSTSSNQPIVLGGQWMSYDQHGESCKKKQFPVRFSSGSSTVTWIVSRDFHDRRE